MTTRPATRLTMDLEYTGDLWAESVLRRILDDEVRARRSGRCAKSSCRRPGAEPAVAPALERQVEAEAGAEVAVVEDVADRPGGVHPAVAQQQDVRHARRDVVDVVRDEHERRRRRVRRRGRPGRPTSCSRPARSSRADGSSSRTSAGSVHQRPGQQDPLALARRQRAERAWRRTARHPSVRGSASARSSSAGVYRCHHGSRAAWRAVRTTSSDGQVLPQLIGEGGGGIADPPAQFADIDTPESLPEHVDGARASGGRTAPATRSSVVLPLPLGPSTSQRSPGRTRNEMSSSISVVPRRTLTWSDLECWAGRHRATGSTRQGSDTRSSRDRHIAVWCPPVTRGRALLVRGVDRPRSRSWCRAPVGAIPGPDEEAAEQAAAEIQAAQDRGQRGGRRVLRGPVRVRAAGRRGASRWRPSRPSCSGRSTRWRRRSRPSP